MQTEPTFTYIKPDAFKHWEEIMALIRKEGFGLLYISQEPLILTRETAEEFYAEHKGRPYFENLIMHTISGPIMAAILEKKNAIEDYRKLLGATNPANAEKGTIRQLYGNAELYAKGITANAAHGSDSPKRVRIESGILIPAAAFVFG